MKLLPYVKQRPLLFDYLPAFLRPAFTIYPNIYLPPEVYQDLLGNNPLPVSRATLVHEQAHWERQRALGILRYGARYLLSKRFRYSEELAAIKPQMQLLYAANSRFDIADRAKRLASIEYLWCVPYKKALGDVTKLSQEFISRKPHR